MTQVAGKTYPLKLVYYPDLNAGPQSHPSASFTRRYEVDAGYLASHRTAKGYRVAAADVEKWLQLRSPGDLYQLFPESPHGKETIIPPSLHDDPPRLVYNIPLTGGTFEALDPDYDDFKPTESRTSTEVVDKTRNKFQGVSPGTVHDNRRKQPDSTPRFGQEYFDDTTFFLRERHANRPPFFRDEVYDFLDAGLLPHRLSVRSSSSTKAQHDHKIRDFKLQSRQFWMVSEEKDSGGRRTLFRLVRPSRSKTTRTYRRTSYGPRVVPPKTEIQDIVAEVGLVR